MSSNKFRIFTILGLVLVYLSGCAHIQSELTTSDRLKIIATTSIVGDVVMQIGGDVIDLDVLLPIENDPHSFQPTPKDIAKVAKADLIFANGAGLEGFLDTVMQNAGGNAVIIYVSDGIPLRHFEDESDDNHEASSATPETNLVHEEDHLDGDPHVWTDPNNVKIWVDNISAALTKYDPAHADIFLQNSNQYQEKLDELDDWIKETVVQVPNENRKLITDHQMLGYFADRYGFSQAGSIIPGYSTMSEPSAQELAKLEDHIKRLGVKAIFVGNSVNPALAERVAEDTGTKLVYFYTGSLSDASGPASTYLDYVRYNVNEIVRALK